MPSKAKVNALDNVERVYNIFSNPDFVNFISWAMMIIGTSIFVEGAGLKVYHYDLTRERNRCYEK